MKKLLIALFLMAFSLSFISALPDIVTGLKTIEITSSNIPGSWYIDGNDLTGAENLNNVELNYLMPENVASAIFYYRVSFTGFSAVEYQSNVDLSCLKDELHLKQRQFFDGMNIILQTSCFDGTNWVVIGEVNYPEHGVDQFNAWYEEKVVAVVSEKVVGLTPEISQSLVSGQVVVKDLGEIEEVISPVYAGIISQTKNSMTEFLEFMSVKIWKKETGTQINDYEVLAMSVNNPDFLNLNRGSLFLESEPGITLKGSTGTFRTYEVSDGTNSGYISDSIDGTSLLFVSASSEPKSYNLFSIYNSAL